MNLGTLKTHVVNRTGNDSISNILTEFVNQIQYDICSRFPFSWRQSLPVSLTTIANQNYINPSAYLTNFESPMDCYELSTPKKLIHIPLWDIGLVDPDYFKNAPSNKRIPTHYNVDFDNSRLWLYPTPNSAISLKIRYYKSPPEISNASSTLFIPSKYHHIVVAGVESLVWQMDEDLRSAQAANTRYEQGIERMIGEDQDKSDEQPTFTPGIVNAPDPSDPFSY